MELKQVVRNCDILLPANSQSGINVFEADSELVEGIVRLLRLLDTPEHAKALAPLIRQEILYRLLTGPSGSRLLEISRRDSPSNRIAKSPSSFHQHFRSVTGMTPIQYQKRARLQEARRILLVDSLDIGEASFRVGYQSHSHFSKDYRQYFGRLPKDDIAVHASGGIPFTAYLPKITADGAR